MSNVVILDPHDPLPTDVDSYILVLARFKDNAPNEVLTEITLHRRAGEDEHAVIREDTGVAAGFHATIARARALAAENGIPTVYAVDRTAGKLEREVIEHQGDRRFEGEPLDDGARSMDAVDASNLSLQRGPEVERDLGGQPDRDLQRGTRR